MALFGQNKTVRGALEERVTDRLLKRAEAPADGRVACLKRTCGGTERAGSRNREKDSDITPLHHNHPHKTERR
ncbi:protein of unknown function (plasmid) [Azospirillum baldaniorum]|uniref:Uncharacterized protein n=1 Tax=Azospirillum baldaniorum TaxID=1064539 RepID=A0A9P1NPM4_9PROT|nr:protein of unknown function [Azospirillum baldaniorum]